VPSVACPFCFRKIDPSRLAYQCSGRGDTECKKATDEARKRLTGSMMATYPTFLPRQADEGRTISCPVCGSPVNRRACPECHTALPVDFAEFGSPLIGLLGAKGSGKTVLMTVLVEQLRDSIGKRFHADIRFATDDPDGVRGVVDYQASREAPLLETGILPPPASALSAGARQHAVPALLRWRQKTTGRMGRNLIKSTMLSFVDTAGEDRAGMSSEFTMQYLSACDGLMIILSPFALPGARASLNLPGMAVQIDNDVPLDVVAAITEMLRTEHNLKTSRKIAIPVAVVFTKMDAFFPTLGGGNPLTTTAPAEPAYADDDCHAVHEHMLALLHQWNAQSIDTHMRLNYKEYCYFGVSALGAEPDYENSTVAPGGVRPHRVEDPVLWLLSKTGTIRVALPAVVSYATGDALTGQQTRRARTETPSQGRLSRASLSRHPASRRWPAYAVQADDRRKRDCRACDPHCAGPRSPYRWPGHPRNKRSQRRNGAARNGCFRGCQGSGLRRAGRRASDKSTGPPRSTQSLPCTCAA
jgi:hypothetical protein